MLTPKRPKRQAPSKAHYHDDDCYTDALRYSSSLLGEAHTYQRSPAQREQPQPRFRLRSALALLFVAALSGALGEWLGWKSVV